MSPEETPSFPSGVASDSTAPDGPTPGQIEVLHGLVPRVVAGCTFETVDEGVRAADRQGRDAGILNDSATIPLRLSDGSHTIGDIIDLLIDAYPEHGASIPLDVMNTLVALYKKQLVTFCGAPFPAHSNPGAYIGHTYHCNRGDIISGWLDDQGWRRAELDEIAELSVWHHANTDRRIAKHQAFEHFQTLDVRSKNRLWENLVAAGVEHIMPETFTDTDSFARHEEADGRLWFLKLSSSTLGRGVFCFVSRQELLEKATALGSQHYVIQKGVDDPLLVDGRKFTVRVYVLLIGDGSVYVHEESLVKIQTAQFDPASTAREVQIDHREAQRLSSDDIDIVRNRFDEICNIAREAFGAVAETMTCAGDPYRFQIFGLDVMLSESRGAVLIEINDWPNIGARGGNPQTLHIRGIKQRVLGDMLEQVLHDTPGRLQRLA